MNKLLFISTIIILFTNCGKKPVEQAEIKGNNKSTKECECIFSDPDTSVSGIKIRNAESFLNILGKKTALKGDSTSIFYSSDKKQQLALDVTPGDGVNQVSIFKISYTENFMQTNKKTAVKVFETEKGIKLGMNKDQIVEKLGKCNKPKSPSKDILELNYRLELPADSKTKLLGNNNMPIYYATYKFKNDALFYFEFGFQNP